MKHLEHKLFDLFDPDDLESLIEELDEVARRTCEVGAVPIDFRFNSWVSFLPQNVDNHLDQSAVDLDSVRVAQCNEPIVERVVSTSILFQ